MIERVQQLRRDAEAQIGEATTSEELDELRVRHLGRRAELPQLLRGVAELPPDERASVGGAANEARRALEDLLERREAGARVPPRLGRHAHSPVPPDRGPGGRR